jgi:hypothetical protein
MEVINVRSEHTDVFYPYFAPDSVGAPATGKNQVSVGASINGKASPDLASFSSR